MSAKTSRSTESKRKPTFTIAQANAMLPLVRAIAQDLADLTREVLDRRARLSEIQPRRKANAPDPYAEERDQVERDLVDDESRLRGYVDELRVLGVEPKEGPDGLIDFPSEREGRRIYLSWRLGEHEVLHWHEPDQASRGSQPLHSIE